MIELISESRCVKCNLCVNVCPTDVFDQGTDGIPVIARRDDCQTCFMCELYCPADAMYVSPLAEEREVVCESMLKERGLLGGYREKVGWGPGRRPVSAHEYMHQLAIRAIP
ncbi:4Fe-4S dicluster domain-containing protein [Paenibacillus ihumii]|uniref:4Fe-4S dicluster domain-containing protein n=1 Tax=Paenibacillus ihumii TaxID=687436 RepID=UPI0006D81C70|nr:ferredoxin family protein [Paenibacillus ihumii]